MSPQKAGLSKQADVYVCTLVCEELALGAWQTWAQILALLLPTWYCTCLWVYLLFTKRDFFHKSVSSLT